MSSKLNRVQGDGPKDKFRWKQQCGVGWIDCRDGDVVVSLTT